MTLEGDILCESVDEALKLSEKIRSRAELRPGQIKAPQDRGKHGGKRPGAENSSRSRYRIAGSSKRWLEYMLRNGNKPALESDLLQLFELKERRQLGGVKTGLRNSLNRAELEFDDVIEQVIQGDDMTYCFRPGAAERVRIILKD
ncbi:MAG: hypothetical protein ACRD6B_11245 [Bryobacteraceae bacterium]